MKTELVTFAKIFFMQDSHQIENDFIKKLKEIIEDNISIESFGVSELAGKIGMSRSNLLRKVQKLTNLSVSQFIRQERLKHAMELLKDSSLNVSEVTYRVGFSSTSYFIKCFREFYGYPPGEIGKREVSEESIDEEQSSTPKKKPLIYAIAFTFLLAAISLFLIINPSIFKKKELEKSIAVLPFINDSSDSTNIHIINGLMESILNNLQKIEDLRVISRTSVEKYRNHEKTIPEIARELNVSYFVEGSGQKIGDKILLNIQLIEAANDKHLWAEQYDRETKDIFKIQMEVAKNIAREIEVIIKPEEEKQIDKIPTDNLVAYDYFLKGLDFLYQETTDGLVNAIANFEKAVENDQEFARAYAGIAIAYFYLDIFLIEKKHTDKINYYADKALLLDSQLPQSLVAKALYYYNIRDYRKAEPYLEKALDYNPNSAMVINLLSDFYATHIPNTGKYLEYALKGVQLDIAANDSSTASYIFLHISNALIQCGFVDEAIRYIDKSLEYNPNNLFSEYVKAYILYTKNRNFEKTKNQLIMAYSRDTTRLDILQEIANICYYMRDNEAAFQYYKKFVETKKAGNLDIFPHKNAQIGYVYSKMGLNKEAEELFNAYFEYAQNDISIYKNLSLAMYYANKGETEPAFEHLRLFSKENDYHYWIIIFVKKDPLLDNIKNNPEFKKIMDELEKKFWKNHKQVKSSLERKGLIG